jgi:hypothetical protein
MGRTELDHQPAEDEHLRRDVLARVRQCPLHGGVVAACELQRDEIEYQPKRGELLDRSIVELGGAVIACSLAETDLVNRKKGWLQLGRRAGLDTLATEDGLRVLFRGAPGVEDELRELAQLERQCCPVAKWTVRSRDNQVMLEVTAEGEEGIVAVQTMFKDLRAKLAATYR